VQFGFEARLVFRAFTLILPLQRAVSGSGDDANEIKREESIKVLKPLDSGSSLLHVSNNVTTFLGLLETVKHHLGTRNVLLGVLQVIEQCLVFPNDTLLLVGVRVGKSFSLTRLTSKDSSKIRSNLVCTSLFNSVALSTTGLEEFGSIGGVSFTS
jgi:hypothetical protein